MYGLHVLEACMGCTGNRFWSTLGTDWVQRGLGSDWTPPG